MSENLAEEVVEAVLQEFKREKLIAGYRRSEKNDDYDASGIDFLIILESGFAIPLQCKTDSKKNEKLISRHNEKHRDIKFVICVRTHGYKRDPQKIFSLARKELLKLIELTPGGGS